MHIHFADALAITDYLKSKGLTGVQGFVSLILCLPTFVSSF